MQFSLRELLFTMAMLGLCLAVARLDTLLALLAVTPAVSGFVGRVAIGTRHGWLVGGAVGLAMVATLVLGAFVMATRN